MTQLEALSRGARVRGVMGDRLVTVVDAKWFGQQAIELTYKIEETGQVGSRLVFRSDEPTLEVVEEGAHWAFDAPGDRFRLAMEATRIRLAYLFDPLLALSTSEVESLPHQISAVYETMLHRRPLRFLLADDPGSGKTILTQQLCFHTASPKNRILYFNTLSEPTAKTLRYLKQFEFFDAEKLGSSVQFVDLGVIVRSQGLEAASALIMEHVKKTNPAAIIPAVRQASIAWADASRHADAHAASSLRSCA
jgi:hypothetical protein